MFMFGQEAFYETYWFMGLMFLLLVALIGAFFYVRNKQPEDD